MVVPSVVTAATTAFMATATTLGSIDLAMLQAIFTAMANNLDVITTAMTNNLDAIATSATSALATVTPQLQRVEVVL